MELYFTGVVWVKPKAATDCSSIHLFSGRVRNLSLSSTEVSRLVSSISGVPIVICMKTNQKCPRNVYDALVKLYPRIFIQLHWFSTRTQFFELCIERSHYINMHRTWSLQAGGIWIWLRKTTKRVREKNFSFIHSLSLFLPLCRHSRTMSGLINTQHEKSEMNIGRKWTNTHLNREKERERETIRWVCRKKIQLNPFFKILR